jgi:HSP90 family molecular chaperone
MAQPRIVPINVSSRVLRHISRGIYRTPAGALKELVSNSYDAGARQVTVTTGWPTLREIVITDNGRGMTTPEFEDIVQHIGFSNKNLGDEILVPRSPVKRRTIGHYGIGLLAVWPAGKRYAGDEQDRRYC